MRSPSPVAEHRLLLRVPGFRLLLGGDFAARLGYQTAQFLFPLIAVVKLHSTGFQTGLISAAQFIPVVIFSLIAGLVAERTRTKGLILVTSVIRGAALGMLGLVCYTLGISIWFLAIAALVVGSATVFYDTGFQSGIPRLLRPAELARGNGLLQASTSTTQMAGPTLAGALLQAAGPPLAIGIIAATFVGAVVAFALLKAADQQWAAPAPNRGAGGRAGQEPDKRSVLTGLRFTWTCRPVRDLCVQAGMFNLHEQAFLTAFLLFGVRSAHLSAAAVGALIGVASVGALIGSLASGRLSPFLHAGATLTIGLPTASAAFLLGPLLTPALPTEVAFGAAFLVNGLALGTYNVYSMSLRQAIPPPESLGSVIASYRMVSWGLIPVGALAGGTLADALGPHSALLTIAASMTLVSLLLLVSPLKRIRRVEEAGYAL
jgi:MFS family permease